MNVLEDKSRKISYEICNSKTNYNLVYGNPKKIRALGLFLQKKFEENKKGEIYRFQKMASNSPIRDCEIRKAIRLYQKPNTLILIPDLNFYLYNPIIAINSFEKLFSGIKKNKKDDRNSLDSKVILLSKDPNIEDVFPFNNDFQKRFKKIISDNFGFYQIA